MTEVKKTTVKKTTTKKSDDNIEAITNLDLWNKFRTPHKDSTKNFTRAGGFRGTAIDPMWLIRSATELWGPMGGKWGILDDSVTDQYIALNDGIMLHISRFILFYPNADNVRVSTIPCVGQTFIVSKTKNGLMADEEAPKKSMTDGLSKGLSWLGFAADVYMGMYDGNKYIDLNDSDGATERKVADYKAGDHSITPTGVKLVKEDPKGGWKLFAIDTSDGEFTTFEPFVANACNRASKNKESINIRFEEKKGRVNAVSVVD